MFAARRCRNHTICIIQLGENHMSICVRVCGKVLLYSFRKRVLIKITKPQISLPRVRHIGFIHYVGIDFFSLTFRFHFTGTMASHIGAGYIINISRNIKRINKIGNIAGPRRRRSKMDSFFDIRLVQKQALTAFKNNSIILGSKSSKVTKLTILYYPINGSHPII